MCIILNDNPHLETLSKNWIKDFYNNNSDGMGVMYVKDGKVITEKTIGTIGEQYELYRKIKELDVDVWIHFRRQTHGDKDLDNCHPYVVFDPETSPHPTIPGYQMYLMHNGVLSFGNSGNVARSDTWHYIEKWLKPILNVAPTLIFTKEFKEMVGDHIGNNRFVIIDNLGNEAIINESQWYKWGDRHMSNTYAWDARKAGVLPRFQSYSGTGRGYYGHLFDDDVWDRDVAPYPLATGTKYGTGGSKGSTVGTQGMITLGSKHDPQDLDDIAYMFYEALVTAGYSELVDIISEDDLMKFFADRSISNAVRYIDDIIAGRIKDVAILAAISPNQSKQYASKEH